MSPWLPLLLLLPSPNVTVTFPWARGRSVSLILMATMILLLLSARWCVNQELSHRPQFIGISSLAWGEVRTNSEVDWIFFFFFFYEHLLQLIRSAVEGEFFHEVHMHLQEYIFTTAAILAGNSRAQFHVPFTALQFWTIPKSPDAAQVPDSKWNLTLLGLAPIVSGSFIATN